MTFKVTPVCGLKHSRTNGSDKGCFHFGWHSPAAIRGEGQTDREERQSGRNIDGGVEMERRCNIKQICTQELVLNHAAARRQKAVIYLPYERGNNMDGRSALSSAGGAKGEE